MRKLAEEKIVIFSSHILADIWRLCERIFVLNNGELIVEDKPENILSLMSDDSYFIIPKTNLDKVRDYLLILSSVNNVRIQNDRIVFKISEGLSISDIIKDIIDKYEIISFGPNIPDLDQIFTRMVNQS